MYPSDKIDLNISIYRRRSPSDVSFTPACDVRRTGPFLRPSGTWRSPTQQRRAASYRRWKFTYAKCLRRQRGLGSRDCRRSPEGPTCRQGRMLSYDWWHTDTEHIRIHELLSWCERISSFDVFFIVSAHLLQCPRGGRNQMVTETNRQIRFQHSNLFSGVTLHQLYLYFFGKKSSEITQIWASLHVHPVAGAKHKLLQHNMKI